MNKKQGPSLSVEQALSNLNGYTHVNSIPFPVLRASLAMIHQEGVPIQAFFDILAKGSDITFGTRHEIKTRLERATGERIEDKGRHLVLVRRPDEVEKEA